MKISHPAVLCVALILLGDAHGLAGEPSSWPQWRGPLGTGASATAKPPIEWSRTRNIRWKTAIEGRGHSSPIVGGDLVFLTTAIPVGAKLEPRMSGRPGAHDNVAVDRAHAFTLVAIDRESGAIRWKKELDRTVPHEGGHYTASLASASPVTDGERVYAFFGSHGLFCVDFEGNVVWSKQFGKMHSKHGHGEGSSPALADQTLVINWDHEGQSFIVALDTESGEELWRKDRQEVTSWSSPIIVGVGDTKQVVVCGTERVRGYDLKDGAIIWECGGMSANIVATPVAAGGVVYVGSSYEKRALMAISLDGAAGDVTDTDHVLWDRSRGTPYVPSPLLVDGGLYFLTHYQNVMTRVDAISGDDAPGAMRLGELGNIYASPVAANGHVFVTDLDGNTLVFSSTSIPRLEAINRLGEKVSASLALVDDLILIRGDKHLFCVQAEAKPGP
ncbi:MAG: PQQ-binding-like beta-propeller repeat protein [Planctomycetota bacterium]